MTPAARHALLARAQKTHPLDYFYALEDARAEPLKGPPGSPSPRLHGLNRAMLLCPTCEAVHVEVARNLWTMGLRSQALLEWRTAVDLQPRLFSPMLGELFASGAKPQELAAVASSSTARLLDLVAFLNERSRIADAFVVLDQADALGAPRSESLVVRAGLQLATRQTAAAAVTVSEAEAAGIRDPRLAVFRSRILIAQQGANGADAALAVLDEAATRTPANLGVQTERVELVTGFKKWNAASRAIEGYKLALYGSGTSPTPAHIADARIKAEMGRLNAALDEYRIALADQPGNVSLWLEYGRTADAGGHVATAREAYAEAARLSPNSPDILNAQRALEQRRAELRGADDRRPSRPDTPDIIPQVHGDSLVRRSRFCDLPGGAWPPVSPVHPRGGVLLPQRRHPAARLPAVSPVRRRRAPGQVPLPGVRRRPGRGHRLDDRRDVQSRANRPPL